LTSPAIEQSVIAILLVTFSPAPHVPITDTSISAACQYVIFFAIARNSNSCTFIARSIKVFE